ncbi:carboxymuconolactone decarboxylase family protein [bacterium]|nr:carboxymuconolactone decarboxylase family protein [bacterium]
MADELDNFRLYREEMNRKILDSGNLELKRFFALDSAVYQAGSLDARTKELLGLVASTVLRCNDCILYHIDQCIKAGISDAEFRETMSIALVVGGSITIPHMRYAFDMWEKAREHGS